MRRFFRPDRSLPLGIAGPWWYRRALTLPLADAGQHAHVIGVSGSGKSRFLAGFYLSLLRRGLPATLIDPHGDLAELVLAYLVASGIYDHAEPNPYERVVYLDLPAAERAGLCLPLNVFDQPGTPTTIAGNVLEAFHRTWPALGDGAAPRFDKLVQRGIQVLLSNKLPLPLLEGLLADSQLRARLLAQEPDADTVGMFRQQFDRLSAREQIDYADSTLSRITLLTQDPLLKHSLAQPDNLLNFRAILDQNQSLIINLAVQNPGTQRLLGCLLTVAAEQGAKSRAELPAEERLGSHHLVIDEFADFVAQSETALSKMLSQTRKYGLFLVMAHQTYSQASERLRGAIQNAGIEVAFRLGRDDAKQMAPILARVDPRTRRQTVTEDASESAGMAEQWEQLVQQLQDLGQREACIKTPQRPTTKVRTLPVPDPSVNPHRLAAVKARYLATYFRSQPTVQQPLAPPPVPPVRVARRTRREPLDVVDAA